MNVTPSEIMTLVRPMRPKNTEETINQNPRILNGSVIILFTKNEL